MDLFDAIILGSALSPVKPGFHIIVSDVRISSITEFFVKRSGSWLDLWLPTRRSRVQAPAWSRVELSATFFLHTVREQGR